MISHYWSQWDKEELIAMHGIEEDCEDDYPEYDHSDMYIEEEEQNL